jgi:hypothetical protein
VVLAFAAGILGIRSDLLALPPCSLLLVPDPIPRLFQVLVAAYLLDPLTLQRREKNIIQLPLTFAVKD